MANDKDNNKHKWRNKINAERAKQDKPERQRGRDKFSEDLPKGNVNPLDKGGATVSKTKVETPKKDHLQKAKKEPRQNTATKENNKPHIKSAKKNAPSTSVKNAKNIQVQKAKPKGRGPSR